MGLKRSIKRDPNKPETKNGDWGFRGTLTRINRAIDLLDKRQSRPPAEH